MHQQNMKARLRSTVIKVIKATFGLKLKICQVTESCFIVQKQEMCACLWTGHFPPLQLVSDPGDRALHPTDQKASTQKLLQRPNSLQKEPTKEPEDGEFGLKGRPCS